MILIETKHTSSKIPFGNVMKNLSDKAKVRISAICKIIINISLKYI